VSALQMADQTVCGRLRFAVVLSSLRLVCSSIHIGTTEDSVDEGANAKARG